MHDIQSEAELAGVLAHEISHVVQRHHLKAIQSANRMNTLGDLASFAQDTAAQQGSSVSVTVSPELAALKDSIGKLYDKGLNRSDEYEADRLGVELAGKSGYDPYGLPTVLQLLGARGKDDPSMAVLLRTHPSIDDRLKKLEPVIDKLDPAYFPGKELRERYQHFVDI
jgi:predicted Zn-dependent protease